MLSDKDYLPTFYFSMINLEIKVDNRKPVAASKILHEWSVFFTYLKMINVLVKSVRKSIFRKTLFSSIVNLYFDRLLTVM